MIPLLSFLIVGCAPDGAVLPEVRTPPPPFELTLQASNFVAGASMTVDVDGGTPGARVRFAWSLAGLGAGVCPPALNGRCTDMNAPNTPLPVSRAFDATGHATLVATLPAGLAGRYVTLQAAVLGPVVQLSNPIGRPVAEVGTTLDPTGDLDLDGRSIEDGDCADFLPEFGPGQPDAVGDGIDYDCDNGDGGGCQHLSAAGLQALGLSGLDDLAYRDDCTAVTATVLSGTDYVYLIAPDGTVTTDIGFANYDIYAVGVGPDDNLALIMSDDSLCYVGQDIAGTIAPWATGVFTFGASWQDAVNNRCASSIVVDETCIYALNFDGDGTVACVDPPTGAVTPLASLGARLEAVALHPTAGVVVSRGAEVVGIDGTPIVTFGSPILDFVVTADGRIFAELTSREVVVHDGVATTLWATVAGDGKLALSPDHWLVRIMVGPEGTPSFEEWPLP